MDKAYEVTDITLRLVDGVSRKKNPHDNEPLNSLRRFIEESPSVWSTPAEIREGTGMRMERISPALWALRESGEVIKSKEDDRTTGHARYTTLKHYHDKTPLGTRMVAVLYGYLAGSSKR